MVLVNFSILKMKAISVKVVQAEGGCQLVSRPSHLSFDIQHYSPTASPCTLSKRLDHALDRTDYSNGFPTKL